MQRTRLFVIISIVLLFALNIFFALQWILTLNSLRAAEQQLRVQVTSEKVQLFTEFFIDKVLLSSGTVGFENRLKLENSVRDINNQQIFDQWQKFTSAASDSDAQKAAGELLKLLIKNM